MCHMREASIPLGMVKGGAAEAEAVTAEANPGPPYPRLRTPGFGWGDALSGG